jgi:hypothetical protein
MDQDIGRGVGRGHRVNVRTGSGADDHSRPGQPCHRGPGPGAPARPAPVRRPAGGASGAGRLSPHLIWTRRDRGPPDRTPTRDQGPTGLKDGATRCPPGSAPAACADLSRN